MSSVERRYLFSDLNLDCESSTYYETRHVALVMLAVWAVGCPVLYTLLLLRCRDALRTSRPTALSRATGFLADDYKQFGFLWEPLEMCRKLTLSTYAATRTVFFALVPVPS